MSGKWKDPSLAKFLKDRRREAEGAIYQWLWDNHATVAAGLAVGEAAWVRLAERIRESGATGQFGGRASRWQVARTWARVCRVKEEAAREAAAKRQGRKPPNRSPRDNQPPMPLAVGMGGTTMAPGRLATSSAANPSTLMQPVTRRPTPNSPTPAQPVTDRPTPEEAREILRRQLDPRNKHFPQPRDTT